MGRNRKRLSAAARVGQNGEVVRVGIGGVGGQGDGEADGVFSANGCGRTRGRQEAVLKAHPKLVGAGRQQAQMEGIGITAQGRQHAQAMEGITIEDVAVGGEAFGVMITGSIREYAFGQDDDRVVGCGVGRQDFEADDGLGRAQGGAGEQEGNDEGFHC